MIHGYHVILPCYGFWLPNDPRGSWSEFVYRWELVRFGRTTRSLERRTLQELTQEELSQRDAARQALKYPPVTLTGTQALLIARAFAEQARKCNYHIWACAILPEHTHLVIARHTYQVEQIVNLLKGAATRYLIGKRAHPLQSCHSSRKRPPRMWAEHEWKSYLDRERAIDDAIAYVNDNPLKEGKPRQTWSFVRPFRGLDSGWITYC